MAVAGLGCRRGLDREVEQEIQARVAERQPPAFVPGVRWNLVQQVYRDHEHRPFWIRGSSPEGRARELVRRICRSGEEGLRPADYDLAGLKQALLDLKPAQRPDPGKLATLDLRLTTIMLGFATDLLSGRLDPRTVDDGWYLTTRRSSVDSTLRAALRDDDSPDVLEKLRPKPKE
jgi:murein L,D-transpeptidase YcbB/YkuD